MTLEDSIKKITRYQYLDFMRYPNVVGVGCGSKFIRGINTGKLCIQVFVVKKHNNNCLGEGCIPSYYQGIQTDVIESGEISINRNKSFSRQQVREGFSDRIRPVKMGYSIGAYTPIYASKGTAGCIVTKTYSSGIVKFYILSNNHVLAHLNKLPLGTPIIQHYDGKLVTDRIGKLSEFVPIKTETPGSQPENYVDAAIAEIDSFNLARPNIAFMTIPKGVNTKVKEDDFIKASGAESGYMAGTIISESSSIEVEDAEGEFYCVDQIISDMKGKDGDSGAIALDKDNNVVGLVFSAEEGSYVAINKISYIQNLLKVEIFTQV